MPDADTIFWIATIVAEHKGTDDVKPMFHETKQIAGKIPSILVSDGAHIFGEAHHDEYAPQKLLAQGFHTYQTHPCRCFPGNNQMEPFNTRSIRAREKVTHGIKKDDSAIISGMRLYHNHVRPHLGLPDNIALGEAAGIHIQGYNKIRTLIQAATEANA